ncbi:MAG TPA: hypothetical protein VEI53_14140, partial [Ktedonobacteraceae bacterium]|nr:hypothetical protein [Ktedonobacteraceae bacterium]
MRRRTFFKTVIGVSGTLLGVKFFSSYWSRGKEGPIPTSTETAITRNPIRLENTLPGTTQWQIPEGKTATTQIQAYTSARSVTPGQKLSIYVSTQYEGTTYDIEIYRMGWYQGKGGRLMT